MNAPMKTQKGVLATLQGQGAAQNPLVPVSQQSRIDAQGMLAPAPLDSLGGWRRPAVFSQANPQSTGTGIDFSNLVWDRNWRETAAERAYWDKQVTAPVLGPDAKYDDSALNTANMVPGQEGNEKYNLAMKADKSIYGFVNQYVGKDATKLDNKVRNVVAKAGKPVAKLHKKIHKKLKKVFGF